MREEERRLTTTRAIAGVAVALGALALALGLFALTRGAQAAPAGAPQDDSVGTDACSRRRRPPRRSLPAR